MQNWIRGHKQLSQIFVSTAVKVSSAVPNLHRPFAGSEVADQAGTGSLLHRNQSMHDCYVGPTIVLVMNSEAVAALRAKVRNSLRVSMSGSASVCRHRHVLSIAQGAVQIVRLWM
jgi:hypothetical protein